MGMVVLVEGDNELENSNESKQNESNKEKNIVSQSQDESSNELHKNRCKRNCCCIFGHNKRECINKAKDDKNSDEIVIENETGIKVKTENKVKMDNNDAVVEDKNGKK